MNLNKVLLVSGNQIPLINEDVRLNLFSPGRAAFTVMSDTPLSGIVSLSIGYQAKALSSIFTGYIESSNAIDDQQQRLFCRELTATLNRPLFLSLRHPTMQDTLREIAADTGLVFVTPEQPYARSMVPRFDSAGNGYHAMISVADVYKVPQYIWQQQGDSNVYVGSWADSAWPSKEIDIPSRWFSSHGLSGRAKIPAIPRLRPGIKINNNFLIELTFIGNSMNLVWSKNPWNHKYGK